MIYAASGLLHSFRPTGGYMSDIIKKNCGAPIILWSVDTEDWKLYEMKTRFTAKILSEVKRRRYSAYARYLPTTAKAN